MEEEGSSGEVLVGGFSMGGGVSGGEISWER